MAVHLNDSRDRTGVSINGQRLQDTGQRAPAKSILASLLGLSQPRCPDCRKRAMVCRYEVPASYNEPSPRYFECEHCTARYFRMVTGPWISAKGPQFARCYEIGFAQA